MARPPSRPFRRLLSGIVALCCLPQAGVAAPASGAPVVYAISADSCRFAALPLELKRDAKSPSGYSARLEVAPTPVNEDNELNRMRVSLERGPDGDAVPSGIDFVFGAAEDFGADCRCPLRDALAGGGDVGARRRRLEVPDLKSREYL